MHTIAFANLFTEIVGYLATTSKTSSQNIESLSLTPEFFFLPSCTDPVFWNFLMTSVNLVGFKSFFFLPAIPNFLKYSRRTLVGEQSAAYCWTIYLNLLFFSKHCCQYLGVLFYFQLSKYSYFFET